MRAMLDLLRDLVAHKGYADAAMLGAVRRCDGAGADADLLALFGHMLIANRFWLLSAAGLPFVFEQEWQPQASLDEVISRFRATHEQERDWVAAATDGDLTRTIETPLIPGGRCTVAQGLTQLCLHSHGHRAQCAKLLRAHGGTPPVSDFIVWVATRPLPAWPEH
jgi:uncharacterized damage-inducible protein DinB